MTEQDKIAIKEAVDVINNILNETSKIIENGLILSRSRQLSNQAMEDLKKIIDASEKIILVRTALNSLINQENDKQTEN